ncbi:aminotransferase class I/II-fold pyridoxal phosphate-dependent enzyme [Brevibacillus centrosporus]|jgi:LL-diaminopimelate aminotransferase|uniref:aminotransferase class I/II-fold pyridoxal phosphate-dependent enzyme n=1 Tax=Brevibacillus centrosporus TaxID=54910 RepID=UPI000F09B18C|nr:aminotransferase class I/II-fold pyridoxal phosphate-dependent enzyme [Brevibacillus centrosporus]MEC2131729.1 aminotransferase class I/II-fold pyridoxal phosphate-dependent enzyme [Brevibacillus centrosporus]MED4908441.1 aminotransferase class I/II-fold pyridoxal phosphate-dependent enzyme [Brevibacillus centrosporus]RNB67377.1 aminotransferase class I/II-fold pyridoxal phosphate-dependent enzyme [Brevibacillus centrosporus]GED34383.1 aminotransferase [Brevibacillus centrosporus]
MRQPSKRLAYLSAAIFSEMAARKREVAQKRKVYDLSIGSPDQQPESHLLETLVEAVQQPGAFGYALSEGTAAFREEVARWYQFRFEVELDPQTEVHSLMGSQDGLAHFALAWSDPGDLVLVPDPGYPIYEGSVHLAGAVPYPMPLRGENGFLPDLNAIPADVAKQAKFMILNYPNNPVSAVATLSFFEEVVAFAKRHDIIVVHDLAYSEMAFDGYKPPSFLQASGAKEVGIEFNSFSKSFNMAGCRIAYVVGNADIIKPLAVVKSNVDYGVFLPVQQMAVEALRADRKSGGANAVGPIYQERRDVLLSALAEAGWQIEPPKATMFVWAKVPDGWTSREFAFALLEETGVVVIPGSAFGVEGEGYVRIALVQTPDVLKQAAESIRQSGILTSRQNRKSPVHE